MSTETAQLRDVIADMNFPQDILALTQSQVDNSVEHTKKQIAGKAIIIKKHPVDINQITEKTDIISKEIDRRVDPQLIKASQEFETLQMSPNVPGKKRKQEISDIIARRNKFIQEFQDKTIEAEKFIKDITLQTRELEEKLKRKKAKEKKKIEEAEASKKQMEEERIKRLEEEKEEKKKKLEKFQEELKSKKAEREKLIGEKMAKADDYIYRKYQLKEAQIKKDEENHFNQLKQEIKQMHKPIDTNVIKEHEKKYLINKKMKEIEREKSLNGERIRSEATVKELSKYKSARDDKFAEEIKESRLMFLKEKEGRTKKLQKMKKVAELMQDLHKPQASEKKKQELMAQIESLRTKPRTHKELRSANYSPRENMTDAETMGITNELQRYPWRSNISKNPKKQDLVLPEITTKPSYINYLEKIKKERKPIESGKSIQKILDQVGMSKKEKYDRVRAEVEQMEEKAMRKEQLMAASKKPDHKNFEEASDMFINAIRAKLTLLDEI